MFPNPVLVGYMYLKILYGLVQERWLLPLSCWIQIRGWEERGCWSVFESLWGVLLVTDLITYMSFLTALILSFFFLLYRLLLLLLRLNSLLPILSDWDWLWTSLSSTTRSWTHLKGFIDCFITKNIKGSLFQGFEIVFLFLQGMSPC